MIRDLIKDMKEHNPMLLAVIIVLIILIVGTFLKNTIETYTFSEFKEEAKTEAKEKAINKALERELEAPSAIDVADYLKKAIKFYEGAGKKFTDEVDSEYVLLNDMEIDTEYRHKTLEVLNPNAGITAEDLKKLLLEVRSRNLYFQNKYGEEFGRYYLYVALSQNYCYNEEEFILRGSNSVDEISRLMSNLKDDMIYQVRIYRKYDKDGLLCYHVKIFDDYKYFEEDAEKRMYAPAQLSKLDRDLFDIYMSDEKVSGKTINSFLDEVIEYNSSRKDPENGIVINLNCEVNDDRSYHRNNMTDVEEIKMHKYFIDLVEEFKIRRQSVGMQTAYGYMYTYIVYIEQVYE